MNRSPISPHRANGIGKRSGFALVATLMLMLMLGLLAVGMLSLSSISMRSSGQNSGMSEARSNARMALMIAIGELQKQMGPDQRISANGEVLDDPATPSNEVLHPHWTGVWNSWKAGVGESSQHSTIAKPDGSIDSVSPTYVANRSDNFRGWLLSLDPEEAKDISSPIALVLDGSAIPTGADTAIRLVGDGSLGQSALARDYVSARLLSVTDPGNPGKTTGRYGWWVGDESQKANIMNDSYVSSSPTNLAERLNRQQAPASMGNTVIKGLENVADQSSFAFIPSTNTLGLIDGSTSQVTEGFHDITTMSLGVLADVREGGLKRDLSTILEREIDPEEVYNLTPFEDFSKANSLKANAEDFLLYNFDNILESTSPTGQSSVPIQDLAAYYQLYDGYRSGSMGGIQYSSSDSSPPNNRLTNGIMVSNPDYGVTGTDLDKYLRQYTALYRNPVPVKIEIILSYITETRDFAKEIAAWLVTANGTTPPPVPLKTEDDAKVALNIPGDPYRLQLGISPAITFWNPNNVPIVMNIGDADLYSYRIRETAMPLQFLFFKGSSSNDPNPQYFPSKIVSGNRVPDPLQFTRVTNTNQGELYTLYVSGNYPAVFQPGESKVFALRFASNTGSGTATNNVDFLNRGSGIQENFKPDTEVVPGWNPEKFVRPLVTGKSGGITNGVLTFKESDYISATIDAGGSNTFEVGMTQQSRTKRDLPATKYHFQTSGIRSRLGANAAYKNDLIFKGFPLNGATVIADPTIRTIEVPQKSGIGLKAAMRSPFNPRDDLPQAFFYYGIKAATETHESNNFAGTSDGSARRFPSRPFTHSTAMAPAFLDSLDAASLYSYGWNWFFMPLDNLSDAPIEISGGNSGYYGGGYTAENGATHVVQQQLPLTPPISIATLSHAHLGGFSLATEAPIGGYNGIPGAFGAPANEYKVRESYRRTTATGWCGLAPHTLQAIGNSYAHPTIPPDKAVTTWERKYYGNDPTFTVPFVDHSYLANKALWDEFYFSSISPEPGGSKAYSGGVSAQQVADDFFFGELPLPNPRMVPYVRNFSEDEFSDLFATYDQYKDGFADKVAAHMMVEGPFNINSTSVAAWKALFSSLKGKDVSYLDAKSALVVGMNLDFDKTDGVPIPGGPLPNGKGYEGSSSDPSDREQWTGFRELTDTEIDELAVAMVKQVKLRGPFLSLSDFINRRLEDGSAAKKELALKGALQAAIDDPDVSINEGFRNSTRIFSAREESFVNAAFPEAMEGPVAYGSSAYVDQADILQGLPGQLSPRGDTFIIRAYGDSLDADGNVVARAWCEATLQRFPDYIDPVDAAHVKQADLGKNINKGFGRMFSVIQFRWLNPSEV